MERGDKNLLPTNQQGKHDLEGTPQDEESYLCSSPVALGTECQWVGVVSGGVEQHEQLHVLAS